MDERTAKEKYDNPILGDIVVTKAYPPGTPLHEVTEFEVWDGARWVPSSEGNKDVSAVLK